MIITIFTQSLMSANFSKKIIFSNKTENKFISQKRALFLRLNLKSVDVLMVQYTLAYKVDLIKYLLKVIKNKNLIFLWLFQ